MAKRAGFILCLVVCALGVGAGHARADTPPPTPQVVADGVQIGSVDVSGLSPDFHIGHGSYSVSPHYFHTALPVGPAVQTALTESHGCIRMQVVSPEWLFNRVRVGTLVFIIPA